MNIFTAKEQAFENSTVRQFSQFERVQMKITLSDEMNSETALAIHRVDSVSDRERDRRRDRRRDKEREREREERRQAVSK
jgi:hypothetical protein